MIKKFFTSIFLVYLNCYALFAYAALPENCTNNCVTPFGAQLGISSGIVAYSNCQGTCVHREANFLTEQILENKSIFTGLKWQCVEYARRFLILIKGVTFGSVNYAYEIWHLTHVRSIHNDETHYPLIKFANSSSEKPRIHDMLIYSEKHLNTGHIAIIVGIDAHSIYIAETNYLNKIWEQPNAYARKIAFTELEEKVTLHDDNLIGWMRIAEENADTILCSTEEPN